MDDRSTDDALALFAQSEALAARVFEDTLGKRLASSWAVLAKAALGGEAEAITQATAALIAALAEKDPLASNADELDLVMAAAFGRRAVSLAARRLSSGDPAAALSLLDAVHKIRSFVAARLDRSHPHLVRDLADPRRIEGLLDEIGRRDPSLQSSCSELRSLILAW
jgi:hypothetical protein